MNELSVHIQKLHEKRIKPKKQLWETTLNPETRILAQVCINDTVEADEITTTLMSSNVPPRRAFIMEEAQYATLDV